MNARHEPSKRSIVNDIDWLAARIAEGWTNREIAELAGCSVARVSQCMARNNMVRYHRATEGTKLPTNRCLADPNWLRPYVEAGWTLPKIAAAANCKSQHTVFVWINRHGLHDIWKAARARVDAENVAATAARHAAAKRGPRYPLLRDADALEAAVKERGAAAVSREIGCHVSSVMRALERAGRPCPPIPVERRRKAGPKSSDPRRDAMIVAMVSEGKTRTEVAAAFGLSIARVSEIARAAGLPPGKRGRPRRPRPAPRKITWV